MTHHTPKTLATSRLVIGVPTVPRQLDYVGRSIDSIIAGIPTTAWDRVELVVFDATPPDVHHAAVAEIEERHHKLISAGHLTVLRNEIGYARLRDAAVQGSDGEEAARRTFWQRKLVLDFVHLARFCSDRGDYYLHVEDDSIATADFLPRLTKWFDGDFDDDVHWAFLTLFTFYRLENRQTVSLDKFFSACALLFRSTDLSSVTQYCEESLDRHGLDSLLGDYAEAEGKVVFASSPPLFQHIGLFSSFEGETRTTQAVRFGEGRLTMLRRGLGEAKALLRRDPASMSEFLLGRLNVMAPSLLSLVRSVRRRPGRKRESP
jgi:glycosyl transferase family 54 (putative N-acetylglucosaminyltransferase)